MWDVKSDAEVALAGKLKKMNKNFIPPTRDAGNAWEKWWLRHNQKDDQEEDGDKNWNWMGYDQYRRHQELLTWCLKDICMEALAKGAREIAHSRRSGYPTMP